MELFSEMLLMLTSSSVLSAAGLAHSSSLCPHFSSLVRLKLALPYERHTIEHPKVAELSGCCSAIPEGLPVAFIYSIFTLAGARGSTPAS